jgi:hypothetical protein
MFAAENVCVISSIILAVLITVGERRAIGYGNPLLLQFKVL